MNARPDDVDRANAFYKNPTIEQLFEAKDEPSYLMRVGALQASGAPEQACKQLLRLAPLLFRDPSEHWLNLSEGDRQLVLMALAHLSNKRPGFDEACKTIAQRIDNPGPAMYNGFKKIDTDNGEFLIDELIGEIQKPNG